MNSSAVKWTRRIAVGLVAGWLTANVVSAYAATNPWLTDLLWQPEHDPGALERAVPGLWVEEAGLRGHFVEPDDGNGVVVVVHGFGDDHDAAPVVAAASWLHEAGYGVLALDLGYLHGDHRYTAGPREAQDILAGLDWLESHDLPVAGLWGFSAGAHAALHAASLDPRVPLVVADSAFVDGSTQIRRIAAQTWKLPASAFPLVPPGVRLFSGDRPVDLRDDPWPGTPVLVIRGTEDEAVPPSDARAICTHTDCTLLELAGVGHTKAYETAPDRYRKAALDFIRSHH